MKKLAMFAGALLLALQVNIPAAQSHHSNCTLRCAPSVPARMQAEERHAHIHQARHHYKKHKTQSHARIKKAMGQAYWHGYHDGYRAGAHARRWHAQGHAYRKWVRLPRGKSYHTGHYWYD